MANAPVINLAPTAVDDYHDSLDGSFASLTPVQLAGLLKALRAVGQYGEVHLVVSDGRIRFIRIVQSLSFPSSSMNSD